MKKDLFRIDIDENRVIISLGKIIRFSMIQELEEELANIFDENDIRDLVLDAPSVTRTDPSTYALFTSLSNIAKRQGATFYVGNLSKKLLEYLEELGDTVEYERNVSAMVS